MATEFQMPKLGLTMEQGTILSWMVPDGTEVTQGQAVLVIETDKTETEVECSGSGILKQVGDVGGVFPCGTLIGWLLAPGETAPSAASSPSVAPSGAPVAPVAAVAQPVTRVARQGRLLISPNARRVARELGVDADTVVGTGPDCRIVSEDIERAAASRPAGGQPAATWSTAALPAASTSASPAAVQLAKLLGVNLAAVGTASPDGMVGREDVAEYARSLIARALSQPAAAPGVLPAVPSVAPAALQPPTKIVPLTGMRGTIAKRMYASLADMAQLTLFMDVDMDAAVADRNRRKTLGPPPGFTDYVIKAAALALRQHPTVNSMITADGVALLPDIHVGMAVALDNGLIVPVTHHTDQQSLADLSTETTRLATAARAGKLALADLEGGTFSVTALGMYGVDGFTPVINPPNSAILGVGRLRDDVAWDSDAPRKVTRLTLSLTWDHRVFDGTPAAEFTGTIKRLLEDPAQLD